METLVRKFIYILLSFILLVSLYMLALPIWFDFIIWFFLLLTFTLFFFLNENFTITITIVLLLVIKINKSGANTLPKKNR